MDDISTERTYLQAPLAGYTDLPYRLACREQGAHFMYTALIDAGALVHGNRENDFILKRGETEPWLGVQLLGSIPDDVARSAEMLEDMNYETLDFNMGCPMQKVVRRPAGAALLSPENHELAFKCVKLIRARTRKPFTVKMRILDFDNPQPTLAFCTRLQELGVDGITIHGRLMQSIYAGPVAFNVIRAVRESLSIPVTANGGIFSVGDADRLAEETGCVRLMVARGSIGNPWIFRDLLGGSHLPPTHQELCDTLERHIQGMVECYGERTGLILSRKIFTAYLHGRGYRKEFRVRGSLLSNMLEFQELMALLRDEGPACAVQQGLNS